jgi:hypothetical protein
MKKFARIGCRSRTGLSRVPVKYKRPSQSWDGRFGSWCHPSSASREIQNPAVNVQGFNCQPHSLGRSKDFRKAPRPVTVAVPAKATAFAFALRLRGPFHARASAGLPPFSRLSEEPGARTCPHQRRLYFQMGGEYIPLGDVVKIMDDRTASRKVSQSATPKNMRSKSRFPQ